MNTVEVRKSMQIMFSLPFKHVYVYIYILMHVCIHKYNVLCGVECGTVLEVMILTNLPLNMCQMRPSGPWETWPFCRH